jgi:uncharacterized protein YgiM (DUF1202 family)
MSKKGFLDSIQVKTPCLQSWKEMHGNDEIRFCDHCAKDVHNLSAMTRKKARKIVAQSNGGICVRYIRRPDGRIQTIKNTFHQITRQTGIAAGILGTSLSVSTLAYAQTQTNPNPTDGTQVAETVNLKSDVPKGTISGTISDPNGAVIPFAFVTISNEEAQFHQSANTNSEGVYEFKDVPRGDYKLKFEASGFEPKEIAQISVSEGREETHDAQLAIQTVQTEVTVGGDENELRSLVIVGDMVSTVSETKNKLILAVQADDLEEVKTLISKGKRVNVKDKNYDGNSPLHFAVENGNLEIAEVLLNAGAKINFKNSEKRTPLMMLDEDATPELVNLLLRHGATIDFTDKKKNTALILSAAYADKDVVQTLIGAGANVNAVNKQGETALMNAAENGETEIVQLLLGAGADANVRNRDGKTALSMARTDEAKEFLIAYGANR